MTKPLPMHRTSRRKLIFQIGAFMCGLGILAWFIYTANRPSNRENLDRLIHAPPATLLTLLGLSLATLSLNGTIFFVTIFPVRRVPFWDVQAANGCACVLNYIPFRAGTICRFMIHNRRNGVPLLTIGAWLGAVSATVAATLTPLIAAAVWRKQIDGPFVVAVLIGLFISYSVVLTAARTFAHARGLARLHRLTDPVGINLLNRALRSNAFHNLHHGFAMLAHPGSLAVAMSLRLIDLLVQATRFMVTAKLVGVELNFESALLISATYFLFSLSPAGALGTREGGATGIAKWLAVPGFTTESFVVIALAVTASEMIVNMTCGSIALLFIRPDRLLDSAFSGERPGEPFTTESTEITEITEKAVE